MDKNAIQNQFFSNVFYFSALPDHNFLECAQIWNACSTSFHETVSVADAIAVVDSADANTTRITHVFKWLQQNWITNWTSIWSRRNIHVSLFNEDLSAWLCVYRKLPHYIIMCYLLGLLTSDDGVLAIALYFISILAVLFFMPTLYLPIEYPEMSSRAVLSIFTVSLINFFGHFYRPFVKF